ncbi:MAG TPA: BON domain-containing protein [Lacipirellulaceae bacterium]|nr:BON domain-containing protein [Lacipirellulaceae bacterium]HMP05711.1 BON domain-containing protein [Lacipirellulaceae bacterium]
MLSGPPRARFPFLKQTRTFFPRKDRHMEATVAPSALVDQVHGALRRSPYVSGGNVRIEAQSGVVRLEGAVRSFFQKQMAQEVIRRLDGVERIENCLQVTW